MALFQRATRKVLQNCNFAERKSLFSNGWLTSTNHVQTSGQQECTAPRTDDLFRFLWIKCVAHECTILNSYEKFLISTAKNLDIEYVRTEEPFRTIKRRTLLASRHVHKKYRVQYEFRNYYRNLLFKNLTGSTADTFLEYVERNIPEGVLFIAEKHKLGSLPFDLVDSQPKES